MALFYFSVLGTGSFQVSQAGPEHAIFPSQPPEWLEFGACATELGSGVLLISEFTFLLNSVLIASALSSMT